MKSWKARTLLFFLSQSITLFGSQIVQMAVVWYVTLHTGSGAWVAVFSVCSYLPQFFLSFWGGVWADRFCRKWLIIGADAWIAAVTLCMMVLMPCLSSGSVLLAALLGMSLIRSAGAGIQTPAVNAVIPTLVPAESLMRYNGINAMMQSAVQFAAPAAAAVILTASTLHFTLALDLLTAVLGIGLLALIPLPIQERTQHAPSVWPDLKAGAQYACASRTILHLLTVYGLFVFLTVPAGYLSGLLVSRVYGDTYWHLTAAELSGFGGMLVGGLLMSLWSGFKKRHFTLSAGLALFGAASIAMGVVRHFPVYLVFMALHGIALTSVQTTLTTMQQEAADPSMHGRVFGLMSSLYASCYPIGMALFGPLADRVPLPWMMVGSGAVLLLLAGMTVRFFQQRLSNVKIY